MSLQIEINRLNKICESLKVYIYTLHTCKGLLALVDT